MANENEFLLHAFFMGVFITFVYDLLRIFRRVIPHRGILVSLEDFFFWIYCAIKVFLLMYYESNGTLRWFAVLGALMGMFLYLKLVSPFLVKYVSFFLQKIFLMTVRLLKILLRPLYLLFRKLAAYIRRKKESYAVKRIKRKELGRRTLKKKLTVLLKMFKMGI